MIPRFAPRLGIAEARAALLPSAYDETAFERDFARCFGMREAIVFPYGRLALTCLLRALGLHGREVICPAYTCAVVPQAIVMAGARPVFVDCRDDDFNMDLALVPEVADDRTGALIATSLFGHPVDLDHLRELQRRYPRMHVVHDCCHSFAAEHRGEPVHQHGTAAFFSLGISKMITAIKGGVLTTSDSELAARIRYEREAVVGPRTFARRIGDWAYAALLFGAFREPVYGLVNRCERAGMLDAIAKYHDAERVFTPDDLAGALPRSDLRIGRAQLRRYAAIVNDRRAAAAVYRQALGDGGKLRLPPDIAGATYSHFVVRHQEREKVRRAALARGVQLGTLIDYCAADLGAFSDYRRTTLTHARRLTGEVLNLPVMSPEIAGRVLARMASVLRES